MPAIVVGVAKETVAQYAALSRSLPKSKKGRIMAVDIDAYESKPLTLNEAIQALKETQGPEQEVWVVVRSRKTSKKDQAGQG
jgi:hypothetical protein